MTFPLRPHPSYPALVAAIHPGAPEETTPRGRVIQAAVRPHVALIVGRGRHVIDDLAELDQLIAALTELRGDLEAAAGEFGSGRLW